MITFNDLNDKLVYPVPARILNIWHCLYKLIGSCILMIMCNGTSQTLSRWSLPLLHNKKTLRWIFCFCIWMSYSSSTSCANALILYLYSGQFRAQNSGGTLCRLVSNGRSVSSLSSCESLALSSWAYIYMYLLINSHWAQSYLWKCFASREKTKYYYEQTYSRLDKSTNGA